MSKNKRRHRKPGTQKPEENEPQEERGGGENAANASSKPQDASPGPGALVVSLINLMYTLGDESEIWARRK